MALTQHLINLPRKHLNISPTPTSNQYSGGVNEGQTTKPTCQ